MIYINNINFDDQFKQNENTNILKIDKISYDQKLFSTIFSNSFGNKGYFVDWQNTTTQESILSSFKQYLTTHISDFFNITPNLTITIDETQPWELIFDPTLSQAAIKFHYLDSLHPTINQIATINFILQKTPSQLATNNEPNNIFNFINNNIKQWLDTNRFPPNLEQLTLIIINTINQNLYLMPNVYLTPNKDNQLVFDQTKLKINPELITYNEKTRNYNIGANAINIINNFDSQNMLSLSIALNYDISEPTNNSIIIIASVIGSIFLIILVISIIFVINKYRNDKLCNQNEND